MIRALHAADKYTYHVAWSNEDAEYVGLCSEFPSLSHLASSLDTALAGIIVLVHNALADMHEAKEQPPNPLSLAILRAGIKERS